MAKFKVGDKILLKATLNIIKHAEEYQDYLESIREFLIKNNVFTMDCMMAINYLQEALEEIKRRADNGD